MIRKVPVHQKPGSINLGFLAVKPGLAGFTISAKSLVKLTRVFLVSLASLVIPRKRKLGFTMLLKSINEPGYPGQLGLSWLAWFLIEKNQETGSASLVKY